MLDYFIKVLLCQTLFLIVYDLVLKKETFFQWNRFYLIVTSVIAYIIPLIKINNIQNVVSHEYMVLLPEVVLSPQTVIKEQIDWSVLLFSSLKWVFWIGVVITSILFLVKLFKVIGLIRVSEKEKSKLYQLIYLENQSPFSFFNYIFLSKKLPKKDKQQIIAHELVHVQQKHSLDLLFFEVQKIVFWFNPFSYFYQQRIAELHEFIADAKSIKEIIKADYVQSLLNTTFGTHTISFINPFFQHSLIKKRIVMLNKNRSKQVLKFKYLLLLPALMAMFIYSSCEKQDEVTPEVINEQKIKQSGEKLSQEEIVELLEVLRNSLKDEKGTVKQKMIREELYLYLLKKREELAANSKGGSDVLETIYESNDNARANLENVPFAIISKSPTTLSCKTSPNPKQCFQEEIKQFVNRNYDSSLAGSLNLEPGKTRVWVRFIIDKEGNVTNAKARAAHKSLEEEAIRVVSLLPKMEPGEQSGEKVNVAYTIPITLLAP